MKVSPSVIESVSAVSECVSERGTYKRYYAYVKKIKPVGNREHPRSSDERFERVFPDLLHRTGDD